MRRIGDGSLACQERKRSNKRRDTKTLLREKGARSLGSGTGTGVRREVDGHFQINGDAKFAVWESVNANDFGEVFRTHGVVHRIWEGDENAHAFVVGRTSRDEVNSVL